MYCDRHDRHVTRDERGCAADACADWRFLIPWNLAAYTAPGALIGGQIGARYQGKVSSEKMEKLIAGLLYLIDILLLVTAGTEILTPESPKTLRRR